MPSPGWFKLHRKIFDHWTFRKKPFSPGQALIWLFGRCNFSEREIPAPGRVGPATLYPGEAIISLRLLATTWGWSQMRVARFLKALRNDSTIVTTNEGSFTRLKVLNWKKYQGDDSEDEGTPVSKTSAVPLAAPLAPPSAASSDIRRREEGKEGEEQIWPPPSPKDHEAHQLTKYALTTCYMAGQPATWKQDLRAALERRPVDQVKTWLKENKGKDVIALRDWLRSEDRRRPAVPQANKTPQGSICRACKGEGHTAVKVKRDGKTHDARQPCVTCSGSGRLKEQVPK